MNNFLRHYANYATFALVSLSIGYVLGITTTTGAMSSETKDSESSTRQDGGGDGNETDSSESDIRDRSELAQIKVDDTDDTKLVLVVRTDLDMSIGKIAAQCSHATLACYKALSKSNPSLVRHWEQTGQTKITLQCESEDDLLLLLAQAQSLSLCARSIQDAGRTQVASGSRTVLGIGPGPARLINQVTGKLRLL